jgi:hypothetical protein
MRMGNNGVTRTRAIVGRIMLAVGAGLLIYSVFVYCNADKGIFGIQDFVFSISAGFVSIILLIWGLVLILPPKPREPRTPPDEPTEE